MFFFKVHSILTIKHGRDKGILDVVWACLFLGDPPSETNKFNRQGYVVGVGEASAEVEL